MSTALADAIAARRDDPAALKTFLQELHRADETALRRLVELYGINDCNCPVRTAPCTCIRGHIAGDPVRGIEGCFEKMKSAARRKLFSMLWVDSLEDAEKKLRRRDGFFLADLRDTLNKVQPGLVPVRKFCNCPHRCKLPASGDYPLGRLVLPCPLHPPRESIVPWWALVWIHDRLGLEFEQPPLPPRPVITQRQERPEVYRQRLGLAKANSRPLFHWRHPRDLDATDIKDKVSRRLIPRASNGKDRKDAAGEFTFMGEDAA